MRDTGKLRLSQLTRAQACLSTWAFSRMLASCGTFADSEHSIVKSIISGKDYKPGQKDSILGPDVAQLITDIYSVSLSRTGECPDRQFTVNNPVGFIADYMQTFFAKLSEELDNYLKDIPASRVDTNRFTHFKFDMNDLPWAFEEEEETVRNANRRILDAAGISQKPGRSTRARRNRGQAQ